MVSIVNRRVLFLVFSVAVPGNDSISSSPKHQLPPNQHGLKRSPCFTWILAHFLITPPRQHELNRNKTIIQSSRSRQRWNQTRHTSNNCEFIYLFIARFFVRTLSHLMCIPIGQRWLLPKSLPRRFKLNFWASKSDLFAMFHLCFMFYIFLINDILGSFFDFWDNKILQKQVKYRSHLPPSPDHHYHCLPDSIAEQKETANSTNHRSSEKKSTYAVCFVAIKCTTQIR